MAHAREGKQGEDGMDKLGPQDPAGINFMKS